MPTITKAFSEMYGDGAQLNYKKANLTANNMLKNIAANLSILVIALSAVSRIIYPICLYFLYYWLLV
jgi:hypothetical protein